MYKIVCSWIKTVSSRCLKSFKKHEDKESANCCNQLLKKSSITGFVEISKSKRFLRRKIKTFVFFICAAGFFYQTGAFLQIYLEYPTTQHTREEYPEEIIAPAITICNNNRLLRHRLCKWAPVNCDWNTATTFEEFCETHKRWCNYREGKWYEIEDFDFAWPLTNGEYIWDRSNRFLNLVGPQNATDFIIHCVIRIDGVFVECNSSIMIQAPNDGYPYRCFSHFSLLGKPNEESLKLSASDIYLIILFLQPEEYIEDNDLVQAWIVLHDPRKLVNPMTEGVPLKGGKNYKLFPSMKKILNLPPPYASKCVDYLNEWKKNGGYGSLSKKDCIDVCLMKAMDDYSGCVEHEITYPNNFTICDHENIYSTPETMKKCSSICGDACEEIIYSFTSQATLDFSEMCHPKNEKCKSDFIGFEVHFHRMMVQNVQRIPWFESIELFSYIGGYLGMWLGISLASLFDLGEMVYDTAYPLLKRMIKLKTTTPIKKFRPHTV